MYYNIRATCDNEIMQQNSFSSYIFIFIRDKSMFINVGKNRKVYLSFCKLSIGVNHFC